PILILARRDAFFVTMVEPFLNHTHSVWFSLYKKGYRFFKSIT
ncbi:hypothetical protein ACUXS1_001196, partial [Staphylococcus warneri]